jgi:hypothetical protein
MTPYRLSLVMALALTAGCGGSGSGGSGLNPFGWFSGPRDNRVALEPEGGFATFEDTRPMVAQVTQTRFEPVVGGGVVHAVGLPPTQGYWDGELVEVSADPPEDGVLVLEFRIRPPLDAARSSVPRSREVAVAAYLSNPRLLPLREIRIVGAQNSISVRR